MSFTGKNGLITGGCGGLGKAIAESFLSEGANLVVCDIRKSLIDSFNENVSAAHPNHTLVLECDITNDSSIDDIFAQAKKVFGHLDFVVNCAGIMDKFDPVGDVERSMWDKVIALNLTAPAMVTKRAVEMMIEAEVHGSIVHIGSIAGVAGFASGVAYTVSKHGLMGLTKNTAAFYGPKAGIRCNAVLPGTMATNIVKHLGSELNAEALEMFRKTHPGDLMPLIETEKVAKLVLYICSDAGEIMNGACVLADGGTIAH